MMRRLVFWQNFPSNHQSALIRALSARQDLDVTLVCEGNLPQRRRNIGWSVPDFGDTRLLIRPDQATIVRLLAEADSESAHIFSGTRAYPMVWKAFLYCRHTQAQIGIYAETGNWLGLKGCIRLSRSRLDALRYRKRVNFVLAIGHMGVQWFRMSGYPDYKIYPFGYFVERSPKVDVELEQETYPSDTTVKLVFIGQCIHRKGIDILLRALHDLKHLNWRLQIVGDGPERENLESLCVNLELSEHVCFLGAQENQETMRILDGNDLLVLPSRWDGWGAVVNEALMHGVPVVCSDLCGAADLLQNRERGEVFSSVSVSALREVLARRISQGKRTPELTARIKRWSRNIEGEVAAGYLLDVIEVSAAGRPKPTPPWLR